MAKTKQQRRIPRAAMTGLREMPANTAWLLAKALKPVTGTASAASGVSEGVSDAMSSAADGAVRQIVQATEDSVGRPGSLRQLHEQV